ncbi:hypothetical protein evm_007822 [Chilo suppressalis]|nr:hypothetical protein evm_007822 [Chilo suppressalis]
MSAQKNVDTKIPDDGNTDSGFLSGPIDPLDSGDLGAPSDRISGTVTCDITSEEENPDSGLDLCTSFSNLDLNTPLPTHSTSLSDKTQLQIPPQTRLLFKQDADGDTQLHIAAVHGSEKFVGILIHLCPDKSLLNLQNDYRHTPLHLAVMGGYAVVVKMLVIAGASLDVRDVCGRTPLHIAAETRDVECLKAMLAPIEEQPHRKLASVLNQKDFNGQTCVHVAANAGHLKTLQTLVYYGADINAKEGLAGWTALHIAARRGDTRTTQYLLEQCADVARSQRDYGGRTPRRLARRTKCERLFAKYADGDSDTDDDDDYDSEGDTLFEKLLSNPNPINVA